MDTVDVLLTAREIAMGAHTGCMRNITAIDRPPAYGCDEDQTWNIHIEGACGEIAVAKLLDRFWSPTVNTFAAPDIGMDIQVRTRSLHHYELIHRQRDNPAHAYVLVTGRAPKFTVRGYFFGHAARRDEWLADHGGRPSAWFVPQKALLPWRDLLHRHEGVANVVA